MAEWSETWTFVDGGWHEGNVPLIGPRTHAFWQGSSVFDGARAFEGVLPDIELHAERVNRSAAALGLKATMAAGEIAELAREGVRRFAPDAAIYIRPMYWAEQGGFMSVPPDPESTRFLLSLYVAPMQASTGFSAGISRWRRPSNEVAPTDAKAGCLYPQSGRALKEVQVRGFENALMLDMLGNVAEFATANVFIARDGRVATPAPNGSFLNGITRQRVIGLLRGAGVEVVETQLRAEDVLGADEVFATGNFSKVVAVSRVEDRHFQPGPLMRQARELYWDFAHG